MWFLLLVACSTSPPAPAPPPVPAERAGPTNPELAIDLDDPGTCAACHQAVHAEWTESMHSRAHMDGDPVFAAMRTLRMEKQGEKVGAKCLNCHTPRAPTDPDAAAAKAGVSCAACHAVASVQRDEGQLGAKALRYGVDGVLRSGRDLPPGASPVHGTGPALAEMADGQSLCLACHDATTNPAGAPACTTGPEHAEGADPGQTCVSCHMPEVEGPSGAMTDRASHRSHRFLGPHRAWLQDDPAILADAVDLAATLKDDRLSVVLSNQAAHAFPTGFPGRVAFLTAVGRDATGQDVWRSPEGWVVLGKRYVDSDGNPTMPPFAKELAADSRLPPDGERRYEAVVPPTVVSADVSLHFRLIPPPAVAALGLQGTPEAEPRLVRSITVTR